MALITRNLFGEVNDKVQWAINLLRSFCPPEGYFFAYSGGKDSVCAKKILDLAGVKYDTHYNVTTVDPPELVRFIIRQFDGVIYDMPDEVTQKFYRVQDGRLRRVDRADMLGPSVIHFAIPELTMRELIVKKQFPPTRLQRYCCERLKESSGKYRITVTGVRHSESKSRKDNQGPVVIFDGKIGVLQAEEQGVNFTKTVRGGGLFLTMMTRRCAARWKIVTAQLKRSLIQSSISRRRMFGSSYTSTNCPIASCTTRA